MRMNEGVPMMYHGNGGFGGPGQMFLMGGQAERTTRHYPMDALQSLSGSPGGHNTPRRWQPRRERHPNSKNADNTAFGYDSDDSSLSSNASGSNKSGEKGKSL